MMTSIDITAPLVNRRTEKLLTRVDPLGFRDDFRYTFEMEILDAIESESQARVMVGDSLLKDGSTYNDFYGCGTSLEEAVRDADRFADSLSGANVDVIVQTRLILRPVFFDDKTPPFHGGAVRCFEVPQTWRRQEDNTGLGATHDLITWKNGADGPDRAAFAARIADALAGDVAGARRKGSLRGTRRA